MNSVDEKVIVIDIDGTLCTIEKDYAKCKLLDGAQEALKRIRERGYKIYLHTGRHINSYDVTKKWLDENHVIYDLLVFGKPPAKYYIDDKGIQFSSWAKVLEQIEL